MWNFFWNTMTMKFKIVALGSLLALMALIFWAFSGQTVKPEPANILVNQGIDQGKNAVITNLVTNQEVVVNNASNNTNQAVDTFHDSVNRDSSTFNGSSTDRFCQRFTCDSTCLAWRKSRPDADCR